MIGDRLNIKEEHVRAAKGILEFILPQIEASVGKLILTVAGESGAGKSEIASALSGQLSAKGINNIILQQDDYFVYPPKTNAGMREKDIKHVGTSEVQLILMDENIQDILDGRKEIKKPLVIYEEDCITDETIQLEGVKAVIVEGTYVSLLQNVHQRIFINRTRQDTKESRKERGREDQDKYLEKILDIEHKIISPHKMRADIIVTRNYDVEVKNAIT
jgi:uridine kinase